MTDRMHHPDEALITEPQEKPENIIQCGGLLNIGGANELHEQLLAACQHGKTVILDLADPERIDTAGVQLLCSLINYSKQKVIPIQWRNVPSMLQDTATRLGMGDLLELPPE
ncbi:MAG: lipid asymmetry maintenance protein MlaB [Gammaproteobacteria bacterium]